MSKEYYFISDLHIGGDGALALCDFKKELINFLKVLGAKKRETELVMVGDIFGMWEMTETTGLKKLEHIIYTHSDIFEQLRKTGEKIKITLIPGNHDHELACYDNSTEILKRYNINFEAKEHIVRKIKDKKIWIEHGCQHDEYSRILRFGDPHANPLSYYTTVKIIAMASRHSDFGKGNWLKDIEGVYPKEYTPSWLYSNYYYREMNTALRWAVLPFVFFFLFSILIAVLYILNLFGFEGVNFFTSSYLFFNILRIVFIVNATLIFLILLSAPALFLLVRDVRKTLLRYGIYTKEFLRTQKEEKYIEAAREIFRNHQDISIFIYGHTHKVGFNKRGNHVIVNTGTWLKKLKRIKSIFKFFPDVYYPSFELSYFVIKEEKGKVAIKYNKIKKDVRPELTFFQRLMIIGREKYDDPNIPRVTYLE